MSIAVLSEVYDEMRRLAIAGSSLAHGDFRLKKLVPPLKKAGEKAPVFAKVADAVQHLIDCPEKDSAAALLELSTLVSAILYTQGETGAEGALEPIPTTDLALPATQTSARLLKPLIEALIGTGSGRHEIIVDAHRRGAFKDLRLLKPALEAIDDGYAEIGDFVADKVLPLYGRVIYDDLKAQYDPKGKGGAVRRLRLMHHLDREATAPLVEQALESGSKDVKLGALKCLEGSAEALPYILEQTKAKSAEVRGTALRCLAKFTDDAVVDALVKAISGADLELASQPASQNPSPKLLAFLLDAADKQLAALLSSKDKDQVKKLSSRYYGLLDCFASRSDKQTVAMLTRLFERREEIAKVKGDCSGLDINRKVVELLVRTKTKPAFKLVVDAHATLSADLLDMAFRAAVHSRTPAQVYEMFSPYYLAATSKKKGRDPAAQKREAVRQVLWGSRRQDAFFCAISWDDEVWDDDEDDDTSAKAQPTVEWDLRWLDAAVKAEDLELVQTLAPPGHAGACELLAKAMAAVLKAKSVGDYQTWNLLESMIRIQHPQTVDFYLAALQKAGRSKQTYSTYWLARLIPDLPACAAPQLEALLPSLSEKMLDAIVPYLTELKTKSV